jgi:cytidylate kinase
MMPADEASAVRASPAGNVDTSTLVVAIDGPSGSGKSTVARGVARALGLRYLDTGAVYRALTWAVLDHGVDPADSDGVVSIAEKFDVELSTDPDDAAVVLAGKDISTAIRGVAVTGAVSAVSAIPDVRRRMVASSSKVVISVRLYAQIRRSRSSSRRQPMPVRRDAQPTAPSR